MCHTLNGILDRMSEVVHRIDAPLVTGVVVGHVGHAVDARLPHVDVGGAHVDLGAQHLLAVGVFALTHLFKKLKILFYSTVSVRALFTWLCKSSSVLTNLVCSQVADKGLAFLNKLHCCLIHLIKIIRCKEKSVFPVCTKPFHVSLDGLYKFGFLLCRVGIIKTEIEFSVVFLSQSII